MRLLTSTLVLAALLATGPAAAQQGDLTKVLQQRYSDWMNAFRGADGAAMDKLEADGLVLVMGSNGMIWSKEKPRVEEMKGMKPSRVSHTLEQVRARAQGDVAVLTGIQNDVDASDGSKSKALFTTVWKRDAGAWKIWSAHWSDVPAGK